MQSIGNFDLNNEGGYVVSMDYLYMDGTGQLVKVNGGGSFPIGQSRTEDPGSYGVPSNSVIWLVADVKLGKDVQAAQGFLYVSGNNQTANYVCSSTAWNPQLALVNVS